MVRVLLYTLSYFSGSCGELFTKVRYSPSIAYLPSPSCKCFIVHFDLKIMPLVTKKINNRPLSELKFSIDIMRQ